MGLFVRFVREWDWSQWRWSNNTKFKSYLFFYISLNVISCIYGIFSVDMILKILWLIWNVALPLLYISLYDNVHIKRRKLKPRIWEIKCFAHCNNATFIKWTVIEMHIVNIYIIIKFPDSCGYQLIEVERFFSAFVWCTSLSLSIYLYLPSWTVQCMREHSERTTNNKVLSALNAYKQAQATRLDQQNHLTLMYVYWFYL